MVVPSMDPNDQLIDDRGEVARNFDDWSSNSESLSSGKVNWAQTYSSDEESQRNSNSNSHRRKIRRHGSVPTLVESLATVAVDQATPRWNQSIINSGEEPHRRPRTVLRVPVPASTAMSDDDITDSEDDEAAHFSDPEDEARRKAASPRRDLSSMIRTVALCRPVRWLFILFVMTCYTTFWLPYPRVRPHVTIVVPQFNHTQLGGGFHHGTTSNTVTTARVATLPVIVHARASADVEFTYNPGLDRYYEQEGFSSHAWTKYANVWALGTVLAWAVREHRRREEYLGNTALSSSFLSSLFFLS